MQFKDQEYVDRYSALRMGATVPENTVSHIL